MSRKKAHGQVRRSQVITTYGPGALIDLPHASAIVGGLDTWPPTTQLDEIHEPRLSRKLQHMLSLPTPRLFAPPPDSSDPQEPTRGITVWRFPEWFVVQEARDGEESDRSRRLVHRRALDERFRFDSRPVVAIRFVRACPRGHVDDIDWYGYVHGPEDTCNLQLWLDERGTSGDLIDLTVRCECGKSRPLYQATLLEENPLGTCQGVRPWLGAHAREECNLPSRLLTRTATNAYFSQVMSVLSLPDRGTAVDEVVGELWDKLQIVDTLEKLTFAKGYPEVAAKLAPFDDEEVLKAIDTRKSGRGEDRPVKQVELDAILAAPEGYGDDVPVDPDFHARRLPDSAWRTDEVSASLQAVYQLHRLREVLALVGFTRFEAVTPDIDGEYEGDVRRAALAREPAWFPAVENRGEGIFIQLRADAVWDWMGRTAVKDRLEHLSAGHHRWKEGRRQPREFPGGPYILLHTLSHLLIQSLSMSCGYPASSIRERVYVDLAGGRFGILLYTASPDAEGTLGGLVQQARHMEEHLTSALRMGALCSNDPVCANHDAADTLEARWLLGASCHGCTLIAETSCEMRNDYLDRALVVPILGLRDAAFFGAVL